MNSRRTMVLKGDATKPEQLFAGVVVKSEIFPSLTKRVAPLLSGSYQCHVNRDQLRKTANKD